MFVNIKVILLTPVIYFLMHTHAYAYLDPGTGSIILTAIISFIAIMSLKIKIYFQKIKDFFNKSKIKK